MKRAWRNNYSDKLSWPEVIGKEVKFFIKDIKKWISNKGKLPVIVTYPDFPSKRTTIFKIADHLHYRLTNRLVASAEVVLYFRDETFSSPTAEILAIKKYVLNLQVTDISKSKVDEVHQKVFGYSTIIDPRVFNGVAVKKSNLNALHDGEIVQCPIAEVNSSSIYQILIDNSEPNDFVVDYRVPVIKGKIPLCYKKYKSAKVRFTNEVTYSTLHDPFEVFSAKEIEKIEFFSTQFHLDFGELDILRHKDGRIFIIDVNKTPYGPPVGLSEEENKKAVSALTALFKSAFLNT